jgi:hypothetical protein
MAVTAAAWGDPSLIRIITAGPATEAHLAALRVPIYARLSGWLIGEADQAQLDALRAQGVDIAVIDPEPWTGQYYLVSTIDVGQVGPQATVLYRGDDYALVRTDTALRLSSPEHRDFVRLVRSPLSFHTATPREHARTRIPTAKATNPFIQQLVDSVSADSLHSYIQGLEDFYTRYFYADSCNAAGEWLYQKLQSFGLDSVAYDSFDYGGRWGMNVVGTKRGIATPDRILIICGHYDSITWDSYGNPYAPAPGADDNASGTAAVLEAARLMAPYSFDATIKFIAFPAEEQGLIGSQHYASNARAQGLDIQGVLNFDMIGYCDDALLDVILYTDSLGQPLADLEEQLGNDYTPLFIYNSHQNSAGSDHLPFQEEGYPATFAIELAQTQFNPNYHSAFDLLSGLSMPLAQEITRMGVATLATLGLAPMSPTGLNALPVRSGGSLYIVWDRNPESDIAGYRLYYGTSPASYGAPVEVGDTTAYTLNGLTNGIPYYLALSAYDSDGWESWLCGEVMSMPAVLSMDHGILLVDETYDGTGSPVTQPTDAQQDSFYARVLDGYYFTQWDCAQQATTPNLMDLGSYSTVVWHADDYVQMEIRESVPWLSEYLDAGGNLFLVGWKLLYATMLSGSYPYTFAEGDFAYDYLHLSGGDDSRRNDFVGAAGLLGYSSLDVDTAKTNSGTGRLTYIDTTIPRDAEAIYTFRSATADTLFENKPCGVRNLSPGYNVVMLGFPLYFIEEDQAHALAQVVLNDFGEVPGIADGSGDGAPEKPSAPFISISPTPSSGATTVRFYLPLAEGHAGVRIYNVAGQLVKAIDLPRNPSGLYTFSWRGDGQNGVRLASGVYICQVESGPERLIKRLVLLR